MPTTEAEMPLPLVHVSAVALVDMDGRVLLAQRPEGKPMAGLWEFPGGKIETGETPEQALMELHEELAIDTAESCLAPIGFASHSYDSFHLVMLLFACRKWTGSPRAVEGGALQWVRPNQLRNHPMPAADLPLIPILQDLL